MTKSSHLQFSDSQLVKKWRHRIRLFCSLEEVDDHQADFCLKSGQGQQSALALSLQAPRRVALVRSMETEVHGAVLFNGELAVAL